MAAIKHHGRMISSGRRIVVVFSQHPDYKDKALVVDVLSLPDDFQGKFLKVVDGSEAQSAIDLFDVLHRTVHDESQQTYLQQLSTRRLMQLVPISDIEMTLLPNQTLALRDLLVHLGRLQSDPSGDNTPLSTHNANVEKDEEKLNLAKGMLYHADLIEEDSKRLANQKREEAYKIYPSLRPATDARPGDNIPDLKARMQTLIEENVLLKAKVDASKAKTKTKKSKTARAPRTKRGKENG
jgi:hypothetical protein